MAAASPPESRPPDAASASESEGERIPLRGDGDGRATTTMCHRESIYSFVVFLPPLVRRTHGHYCTLPVLVALMLFITTVVCQLALTLIAGGYIRSKSTNFKVSLVRHEEWKATAITPVDWVRESAAKFGENIGKKWRETKTDQCCDSAECITLYPCCAPGKKVARQKSREQERPTHSFLPPEQHNKSQKFKDLIHRFVLGSSGNVALCRSDKMGVLDCSPPSYSYLDAWSELDANGDGLWSLEEAEDDHNNLGCRLGLSARDFFNSAVRGIVMDARDTADNSYAIPLVPGNIEKRKAIPKDYFEHFKGLVVLCTAFDVGRCGQLISEGTFDGAIGNNSGGAMRGGIHDLDSALDFCQRMLRPDGVCDRSLPHTFRLYRSRVSEKCGGPGYEVGDKYTNKNDPRDAMSIVKVSYSEYSQYETAAQFQFQIFLALILTVWYVTLVLELSRIIAITDMLVNFEHAHHSSYSFFSGDMSVGAEYYNSGVAGTSAGFFANSLTGSDFFKSSDMSRFSGLGADPSEALVITNLSKPHFTMCVMMTCVRVFLWLYMANVGTTFLLATFSYDDLLFNAVALAFIFELPEFLYAFLVADHIKEQLAEAQTVPFPTSLPQHGPKRLLISRAFWGLVLIPLTVYVVCLYNFENNIQSSLEALNCACFQKGPNCVAAQRFNVQWWNQYWKDTLPLAKLRSSYLG